ncbi:MAG TPA: diacylglycerol kinase family lipid kinase [Ignavibacteria bacterium]|nr:diacylglycerol kinase family lipid kinase [Ignavibacteria bacterium]HMR41499.1 diacylglycerol kinase family lipid kinase [Ignavibacteria bacterium]
MSVKNIHIVFNPASTGGKTGENKSMILTELHNQLGNGFELSETRNKTDAHTIAKKAISSGCKIIIAVGGDGTVNQVVNGFFENGSPLNQNPRLGILSFGTGQGFAQSIGLPKDIISQIKIIRNDYTRSIDVGKISFVNGQPSMYFVNELQFGIGGTICKNITPVVKKLLGKSAFGFEAVKTLMRQRANQFTMKINGKSITQNMIGVIIANGAYTGGGMRLTPDAIPDDGFFEVLLIKEMSLLKRLRSFTKIYSGKHLDMSGFQLFRTNELEFDNENFPDAEADGELISTKCISAEVIPSALKVLMKN